jgi:hypothetical protein
MLSDKKEVQSCQGSKKAEMYPKGSIKECTKKMT